MKKGSGKSPLPILNTVLSGSKVLTHSGIGKKPVAAVQAAQVPASGKKVGATLKVVAPVQAAPPQTQLSDRKRGNQ